MRHRLHTEELAIIASFMFPATSSGLSLADRITASVKAARQLVLAAEVACEQHNAELDRREAEAQKARDTV